MATVPFYDTARQGFPVSPKTPRSFARRQQLACGQRRRPRQSPEKRKASQTTAGEKGISQTATDGINGRVTLTTLQNICGESPRWLPKQILFFSPCVLREGMTYRGQQPRVPERLPHVRFARFTQGSRQKDFLSPEVSVLHGGAPTSPRTWGGGGGTREKWTGGALTCY